LALLFAATAAEAIEPVNPDLIPEARALWDYLESVYGKRTLSGVSGMGNAEEIHEICEKHPAVVAIDISGWNSPAWGKSYTRVVERYVEQAEAWWQAGGIVTMQFHWKHPGKPDGTAWVGKHGKNPPSGPFDLAAALQAGTDEHKQVMRDLEKTADHLQRLLDARVPVLFRPLHEIDGGWFWWTDRETPENTAGLWRLIFDYYVNERKLDNLIWVYNAALKTPKGRDVEQVDLRRRYYPGAQYVDIAGIDIYANQWYGWPPYQQSAYPKAFRIAEQVAPGKMLALSESGAIPNPDMMAEDGPKWLYCLAWFVGGKHNPPEWVKTTYTHPHIITRDELPDFNALAEKYRQR
jgi:mannan endo-1,4-beta-mannosidase